MVVKKKETMMMRSPPTSVSTPSNNYNNNTQFQFSKLHNHIFVKLALSFLLVGLAFRLFVSNSISLLPPPPAPSSELVLSDPPPAPPDVQTQKLVEEEEEREPINDGSPGGSSSTNTTNPEPEEELVNDSQVPQNSANVSDKCDLFVGDWIRDPSGPLYTNRTCRDIESHQNCMRNGRPDSEYLYWRWNPRGCDLPRFEPERFLELMRNKSWAFIGDSISRNHVQSLLCILSQVEPAVETYHDREFRSRTWRIPSYNFTLSVIWTPFLVRAAIFEDSNGVSTADIQLHLDKLDKKWTRQFQSLDYAVIAGGKWFLKTAIYYEESEVKGCHYCPGKNLTELGFDYAYRKTLQLVFKFIARSNRKVFVLFRTTTPDHFEKGEWFSGGTCNRRAPFKEGEVDLRDVDATMRNIELEEIEKAASNASDNGVTLKVLDTTRLSLLRPDGHPGPYRQYQPFAKNKKAKVQNDCLHWCLPGPIDSWNDLVMELITNADAYR